MHEEALLRDLVRKVDELAVRERATTVRTVRLWVGALSHLRADDLISQWARVAAGTAGARAVVEAVTSTDVRDPRAQGVVLVSLDLAHDPSRGSGPVRDELIRAQSLDEPAPPARRA